MALRGRRTRTVRTAEKLTFCRSSEYSSILQGTQGRASRVSGIIKPPASCSPREFYCLSPLGKVYQRNSLRVVYRNKVNKRTQPGLSPLSHLLWLLLLHRIQGRSFSKSLLTAGGKLPGRALFIMTDCSHVTAQHNEAPPSPDFTHGCSSPVGAPGAAQPHLTLLTTPLLKHSRATGYVTAGIWPSSRRKARETCRKASLKRQSQANATTEPRGSLHSRAPAAAGNHRILISSENYQVPS